VNCQGHCVQLTAKWTCHCTVIVERFGECLCLCL